MIRDRLFFPFVNRARDPLYDPLKQTESVHEDQKEQMFAALILRFSGAQISRRLNYAILRNFVF